MKVVAIIHCLQQGGSVVVSYQEGVAFFCFVFCFSMSQKVWISMPWLASHQLADHRTCPGHNLLADQYWKWTARSGQLWISFKTWLDISPLQCQSVLFQLRRIAWRAVWDPQERWAELPLLLATGSIGWMDELSQKVSVLLSWLLLMEKQTAEFGKSIGKTINLYCSS